MIVVFAGGLIAAGPAAQAGSGPGPGPGPRGQLHSPVAFWSFDEGAQDVVHDVLGQHDGQVQGASWTTGIVGRALQFSGTSDAVSVADSMDMRCGQDVTISAWVRGSLDGYFFTPHAIAYKGGSYYLAIADAHVYARVNTGRWRAVRGATRLSNNQWYHIAMSYDAGQGGQPASLDDFDGLRQVGAAPLITDGGPDDWDQNLREIGNVLYEPDEPNPAWRYKAWYSGFSGAYTQNRVWVGFAVSADSVTWTRRGQVSSLPLEDPYVVHIDGVYYMFAENKGIYPLLNIRRLHSTDLVNWIDDGVVLASRVGGVPNNWEAQDVSSPIVRVEDGIWYLFYEARGQAQPGAIGLATSTDGLTFTRRESPVLTPAGGTAWDGNSLIPDDLVKIGSTYYMTYHGNGPAQIGTWTGLAISTDLVHWTRGPNNPFDVHDTVMMLNQAGQISFFAEDAGTGIGRYRPVIVSAPRVYINGVEDAYWQRTDCENHQIIGSNTRLTIGNSPEGTPYNFSGVIDEVRLFNRLLEPAELAGLAQLPTPCDLNCDGRVNNSDIDPFVMALLDSAQYSANAPFCNRFAADANLDGEVNNFDVDPFISCLLGLP